ncbi:hypothetical protein FRC07_003947 [Ceratobasidium sp. 392]|nr:hypothetical protein FRC07_003947 [Ceratobasidium sp. 392]
MATKTANDSAGALGLPQWTAYKEGDKYKEDVCSKEFEKTMETIVETFEKIKLDTAVQPKENFETALKEDNDLTKKANERMAAIKAPEKTVKVTVDVHKPNGSSLLESPHTVQIGGSTLVSAIEWGVSNIPIVKNESAGKLIHFKLDGKIIAKHQNVGELGPNGTLALIMAITDNPIPLVNENTTQQTG